MQLLACGRRFPAASGGRSVDYAQQRADWELAADLQPSFELIPRPAGHPDLSALAALPPPDEYRAAGSVEIALLERAHFADPQPGAPEQHGQRAEPVAVSPIADGAHDRVDLFNCRWIGRVLLALVAWRSASVIAGHRRGRTAVAGDVQQHGFHESSLDGVDDAAIRITPPGAQEGNWELLPVRALLVSPGRPGALLRPAPLESGRGQACPGPSHTTRHAGPHRAVRSAFPETAVGVGESFQAHGLVPVGVGQRALEWPGPGDAPVALLRCRP